MIIIVVGIMVVFSTSIMDLAIVYLNSKNSYFDQYLQLPSKIDKNDPKCLKLWFLEKNWKYTENELDGTVENDEK